ncbi:MAG: D-sedoheptulose 7-phosphate isomerase [Elusimicrobia bacterium]|nr:MAG: D-sedoheptulose 7-phosphate isomerase [Elusimicrobiota bacterium]
MKRTIEDKLAESSRVIAATAAQSETVSRMAEALITAFQRGHKLLSFGNGGSACDATNFADELTGRYERNRPGLPALSLNTNTSDLTSIANDFGYEFVFERPLRALAKKGDVAVAISTSGNSPNVLKAAEAARELGLTVLGFTGESGGKLKALCDLCLCAPSKSTARVQEAHIAVIQVICGLVEETMFPDAPKAH